MTGPGDQAFQFKSFLSADDCDSHCSFGNLAKSIRLNAALLTPDGVETEMVATSGLRHGSGRHKDIFMLSTSTKEFLLRIHVRFRYIP